MALRSAARRTPLVGVLGAHTARGISSSSANFSGADRREGDGIDFVPREQKASLVEEVFRHVAPSYDVMNDLMSGGMHRLWKDRLVEKLRPRPGQVHLDLAGGTGDVSFRVADAIERVAERESRRGGGSRAHGTRRPPRPAAEAADPAPGAGAAGAADGHPSPPHVSAPPLARIVVSDVNAAMLEQGRARAAERGHPRWSRLEWLQADAEHIPLPDESVDSVTISFGIRNVTDRPAALREARRVLVPGGRFLCLEFSKVIVPGLAELYDAYSFAVIPKVGGLVAGNEDAYSYLVESIRKFPDQETWAATIEEAGFRGVEFENLSLGICAIHSGFKLD